MRKPRARFQEEWLSAAVDGELEPRELTQFEQALSETAALRHEFEALKAVKACVRRCAPRSEVPPRLALRLATHLDEIDQAPPAPRPRAWGWTGWWRPALAFAGLLLAVGLVVSRAPRLAPTEAPVSRQALALDATTLAQSHRDWQARYAAADLSAETPQAMAADLSTRVGYRVAAPLTRSLHAELKGCGSCGRSVPGVSTAVFVMRRADSKPLSLFEVARPAAGVVTTGFAPSSQPGVDIATVGEVNLASWHSADLYAILAGEDLPPEELAALLPTAVEIASQPTDRTQQLGLQPAPSNARLAGR